MRKSKVLGFTLLELLIVIGILAIFFTLALVALNPARQFGKANNSKRQSDTQAILNAIHQYAIDNNGSIPSAITDTAGIIGKSGIDLCGDLIPKYISALPVDPKTNNGTPVTDCASNYTTNYSVVKGGEYTRVTVSAPGAELGEIISFTL